MQTNQNNTFFNIDWDIIVKYLTPPILATIFNLSFIRALIFPIKELNNTFNQFRNDTFYKLCRNGQVCYLQATLNDAFDYELRRIRIEDSGTELLTTIHPDSDEKPIMLQDDETGAFMLHNDSAYGGDYDFIIVVPFKITFGQEQRLRALVEYYKLVGKRYDLLKN